MSTQQTILDIAMNLVRIGNWAADDFDAKEKRIAMFLGQTLTYLDALDNSVNSGPLAKTFERFQREFQVLRHEAIHQPRDTQAWAEKMMTWGNILTHRAKLANV